VAAHRLEFGSSWVRYEGDEPNRRGRPPANGESKSEPGRRPSIVVGWSKGMGSEKIVGWKKKRDRERMSWTIIYIYIYTHI
jgi:hypothetical protein